MQLAGAVQYLQLANARLGRQLVDTGHITDAQVVERASLNSLEEQNA